MTLKELVKDKTVKFSYYREGELWYKIEGEFEFEFPVSIKDTGTGVFLAEDKAIYFMRWIRKHLETQKEWEENGNKMYRRGEWIDIPATA